MPQTMSNLNQALVAKNEQDFADVTGRIEAALKQIRMEPSLKPTHAKLAELAHCSRGTLNNRRWPVDALLAIKRERASKGNEIPLPGRPVESEATQVERLTMQLRLSRDELLAWKLKHDDARDRIRQLENVNGVLLERVVLQEKELGTRRSANSSTVVSLSAARRTPATD